MKIAAALPNNLITAPIFGINKATNKLSTNHMLTLISLNLFLIVGSTSKTP